MIKRKQITIERKSFWVRCPIPQRVVAIRKFGWSKVSSALFEFSFLNQVLSLSIEIRSLFATLYPRKKRFNFLQYFWHTKTECSILFFIWCNINFLPNEMLWYMWTIHWGKNKVAENENWKKKLLCMQVFEDSLICKERVLPIKERFKQGWRYCIII